MKKVVGALGPRGVGLTAYFGKHLARWPAKGLRCFLVHATLSNIQALDESRPEPSVA